MKIILESWINKKYLGREAIMRLKQKYDQAKPYPYLELQEFFNDKKIHDIFKALEYEPFELKDADLFTFLQTNDLKGAFTKEVRMFRTFLISKEFIKYIEDITHEKIKQDAYMHATNYQDTHYLLCHDDQLENRKLALMVYGTDIDEKNGGALRLYDHKNGMPKNIVKKIIPKLNSLVLFKVSNHSFHDVQEVIGDKDRLTIGWWYHD